MTGLPACDHGPMRPWLAVLFAVICIAAPVVGAATPGASSLPPIEASDPWTALQLIRPEGLASLLKAPKGERPLLLHVGFKALYRSGAIPGSRYAGPGSRPEGIAALKLAVKDLPRDRSIVIYCACCPWDHCPNMRPAFQALRQAGYTNVRAFYSPNNLETDWAQKGFPLEKPKD
jgi:thiosulfate/3-mercaptopyruvate sulfurtransferase